MMKKTLLFTNTFVAILLLGLIWGCQSTAVGPSAESQKENLLVRAGFEVEHLYAGYDRSPYGSTYPGELIFVARRRE